MAYPTAVNSKITDSVTSANVQVVALSPAISMGELYQATSQALANAANNATTAQGQINILAEAVTKAGVKLISGAAAA